MNNASMNKHVGVIGATSFVGRSLLSQLTKADFSVTAFSRNTVKEAADGIIWRQYSSSSSDAVQIRDIIPYWICVAPISVLPEYFDLLETMGVRRIVVLSSTSRFSKIESSDVKEQALVKQFEDGESRMQIWAQNKNVEWMILRPTVIYGLGLDKNITVIARFIQRFGFFPLLGEAKGLRQPIHADDVAAACIAAINSRIITNQAYNISGGETLTYREMVERIFNALGKRPYFISVPLVFFKLAVACLRLLPKYRKWSPAMAERMNQDLIFDHTSASEDLGFKPKAFVLTENDLPNK